MTLLERIGEIWAACFEGSTWNYYYGHTTVLESFLSQRAVKLPAVFIGLGGLSASEEAVNEDGTVSVYTTTVTLYVIASQDHSAIAHQFATYWNARGRNIWYNPDDNDAPYHMLLRSIDGRSLPMEGIPATEIQIEV